MTVLQDIIFPTIAAIATSPGRGGIGIVRMSGADALPILQLLFSPHKQHTHSFTFSSHKMHHGWIIDPDSGKAVDEVLAVYMKAPQTYTREDVVEIHCHGSYLVQQQILRKLLSHGARLAEPGEFTKRAFLSGRIDLAKAEAVLDIMQAKTTTGLAMALSQLRGELSERLERVRSALLEIRALLEVAIDFPEEDVAILKPATLARTIEEEVVLPIRDLLRKAQQGKIYREGVTAVLLGRPNVGKSSLLNALLREERAIVTAIPGTTRDIIEEYFDVKGIPVRLADMAGIRESAEEVEVAGIHKARKKAAGADLVLFLVDATTLPSREDRDLYALAANHRTILVLNKIDIACAEAAFRYREDYPDLPLVVISALRHQGIDELENVIFQTLLGGENEFEETPQEFVLNLRHQIALGNALSACEKTMGGIQVGLPPDLLAIDIQTALDHLGDLLGQTTPEDILDMIFSQFCIGK